MSRSPTYLATLFAHTDCIQWGQPPSAVRRLEDLARASAASRDFELRSTGQLRAAVPTFSTSRSSPHRLTCRFDSIEQIRLSFCYPTLHRSCQMKQFAISALAGARFEKRPQRGLGLVGFVGGDLGFQVDPNINRRSLRRERNRLPIG